MSKAEAVAIDQVPERSSVPEGHVSRTLNFKDRLLILQALNAYIVRKEKEQHPGKAGNYAEMARLAKARKALCADEVDEYFDMISECYEGKVSDWAKATNLFRTYRGMRGGIVQEEQFKKMFPDWDPKKEPPKPPFNEPETTDDDKRGKPREFHLKAELDVMIGRALRQMHWTSPADAEFVAEVSEKYGLDEAAE